MPQEKLDTHQKALQFNLDPTIYGSIAEIGAGQEVSGWFFRVGASSGTVAKSISAYDMKVSDDLYGSASRYVSRERLLSMLDREYEQLEKQLNEKRGQDTRFFAYANTISARNYQGTNIAHGWMGIRFQIEPGGEAHTILLHVNMRDDTNILQQEAIGVLGVNVIYGTFFQINTIDRFITHLLDNLSIDRVEVDLIELSGPVFEGINLRLTNLSLLTKKLCHVVMFAPNEKPVAPVNVLYKRPIVIEPGRFEDPNQVYENLLEVACDKFADELDTGGRKPQGLPVIAAYDYRDQSQIKLSNMSARVSRWNKSGRGVMVSTHMRAYQLTEYLTRYTQAPKRFAMGVSTCMKILEETAFRNPEGGVLTMLGALLSQQVKVYVFSMDAKVLLKSLNNPRFNLDNWLIPDTGRVTVHDVYPKTSLGHLYSYLLESGAFIPMDAG